MSYSLYGELCNVIILHDAILHVKKIYEHIVEHVLIL